MNQSGSGCRSPVHVDDLRDMVLRENHHYSCNWELGSLYTHQHLLSAVFQGIWTYYRWKVSLSVTIAGLKSFKLCCLLAKFLNSTMMHHRTASSSYNVNVIPLAQSCPYIRTDGSRASDFMLPRSLSNSYLIAASWTWEHTA